MSDKSSVCVLVSGGLDSDVLLAEMAVRRRRVWPIYIRQGLVWEEVELYWLKRFLASLHANVQALTVLSLPMADLYRNHWSTGRKRVPGARSKDQAVYLPGRNMALSLKAAIFGAMNKVGVLALGSLDHNPFADADPRFFKVWGDALAMGLGRPVHVIAPYRHFSKTEVIRRGRRWRLELSFSCIAPRGRIHCGRCNKCAERRRAFKAADCADKTKYADT